MTTEGGDQIVQPEQIPSAGSTAEQSIVIIPDCQIVYAQHTNCVPVGICAEPFFVYSEVADGSLPEELLDRLGGNCRVVEGGKLVLLACRDVIERREGIGHLIFELVRQAILVTIKSGHATDCPDVNPKLVANHKCWQHRGLAIHVGLVGPKVPAALIRIALEKSFITVENKVAVRPAAIGVFLRLEQRVSKALSRREGRSL